MMRVSLRAVLVAVAVGGAALSASGCGNSACQEMMSKACDECAADLSPEWRAACDCWNDRGVARAKGFRCRDPDAVDQDACRMTLEAWSADACALLSRSVPDQPRLSF